MMWKTLCVVPFLILSTSSSAVLAQEEIVAIPFETIPEGTTFAGANPIEMQSDTEVSGDLSATGPVSSDTGFQFPDGTVQVTAGASGAGTTANAGLYSNTIPDMTPPNPYTEVCFKGGAIENDIHDGGESTAGGDCLPGDTGWLIERFERASMNWTTARVDCLLSGLRLPEPFEWQYSCDNESLFALDAMTGNEEWASNTATPNISGSIVADSVPTAGQSSCGHFSWLHVGSNISLRQSAVFRCAR